MGKGADRGPSGARNGLPERIEMAPVGHEPPDIGTSIVDPLQNVMHRGSTGLTQAIVVGQRADGRKADAETAQ